MKKTPLIDKMILVSIMVSLFGFSLMLLASCATGGSDTPSPDFVGVYEGPLNLNLVTGKSTTAQIDSYVTEQAGQFPWQNILVNPSANAQFTMGCAKTQGETNHYSCVFVETPSLDSITLRGTLTHSLWEGDVIYRGGNFDIIGNGNFTFKRK